MNFKKGDLIIWTKIKSYELVINTFMRNNEELTRVLDFDEDKMFIDERLFIQYSNHIKIFRKDKQIFPKIRE